MIQNVKRAILFAKEGTGNMYIKLYCKIKQEEKVERIRAVNYENKDIDLDLDSYIGCNLDDNLKSKISRALKGCFITGWVLE